MEHQTLVFFDLETGGLDPSRHAIIQLAAVAVDGSLCTLERFEAKVRFDRRDATKAALRKAHYHPGTWAREAIDAEQAARAFAAFLRRHASAPALAADGSRYRVAQLVAHNAAFDGPFLREWYARLGVYLPARFQVACTLQRALWFFSENPDRRPPANFKLATLCRYFAVALHAADSHEALADAAATVGLYRALIDRSRIR